MDPRYAIYFAPAHASPLWQVGCAWLGRDAVSGEPVAQPRVPGFPSERVRAVTAAPRLYGLHATLKPPFQLAVGQSVDALRNCIRQFALARTAFSLPPLQVASLSGFLALRPTTDSHELQTLAHDCVVTFEPFRRPPARDELVRRRAAGLSARQEELLLRYGYPYVLDEFRFHITLTERLDAADAARLQPWLVQHFFTVLEATEQVADVCLFMQERPDAAFRILERCPLSVVPAR